MQAIQKTSNSSTDLVSTEEWLKILSSARSLARSPGSKSPWETADLALLVQTKWAGSKQYNLKTLSGVCQISKQRLSLQARVARFFPPEQRFMQLSFSHHVEAMRSDPERASYWLQQAWEKKWNSKEFRLAIAGEGDPKKLSWLRCGTFWYFSHCDQRFGMEYPGRIPGQIPANVIHYFTEPGDLVVDPMAGGGTTLDAASLLERRCLVYDLFPARPEIKLNDVLTGLPHDTKGAKLIFIDPPYGSIAKGFYDKHPSCLSRMDNIAFLEALTKIAGYCVEVLDPNGFLAILVQNVHNWTGDTVFQIIDKFTQNKWNLVRRIQVPLSNQHISSNVMKWARDNRQMVNTDRDLLVFKLKNNHL
ncbi:MAG: DNA methyltransferase [Potamolinea sp.]